MSNERQRQIAKQAAFWLKVAKSSEIKPSLKYTALHMLYNCQDPSDPVPPPDELIRLVAYLLLPGRHDRTKHSTPFSEDPELDFHYRDLGHAWGFDRPRPETIQKIDDLLIPFELKHDPDPTGQRPSAASDEDVCRHLGERVDNVRRWRSMKGVIEHVRWYREIE